MGEAKSKDRTDEAGRGLWHRHLNPGQARLVVSAIYGAVVGSAVAVANYWLLGPNGTVALSGILAAVGAMAFILYYA
jgi:hypothetical protein